MSISPLLQRGITLIEQIMFIVIVSVGVIGLVSVMNPAIRASADPMLTKQLVAIAESLLNEVVHQPFTWCDPDDGNAATALAYTGPVGPGVCETNPQNALGPVPGDESRSATAPGKGFDNVADYAGFAMDNVADPANGSVLNGYRAEVAIVQAGADFLLPADTVLAVTVTTCRVATPSAPCAGRDSFALTGYRFRYAPRI